MGVARGVGFVGYHTTCLHGVKSTFSKKSMSVSLRSTREPRACKPWLRASGVRVSGGWMNSLTGKNDFTYEVTSSFSGCTSGVPQLCSCRDLAGLQRDACSLYQHFSHLCWGPCRTDGSVAASVFAGKCLCSALTSLVQDP